MAEEKYIINVNGKRMNVLEAQVYFFWIHLKNKKLKLVNEEKQGYLEWKNIRENRNIAAERNNVGKIYKDFSAKTYLTEMLKNKICTFKREEKKEYCSINGHREKKGAEYCPRCGAKYEKGRIL